jgi:uncharacterized repeat protein (TIGR03803 family)
MASSATLPLTVGPPPAPYHPGQILYNFGNAPDAWQPWGSPTLVQTSSGPVLYGYTANGGDFQLGAIFRIYTDGTGYQVVHSFGGLITGPGGTVLLDGGNPHHDSLRIQGNELLGATVDVGDAGQGVLYAYNYVTGSYRIIHELNGFSKSNPDGSQDDGAQPHSNPMYSTSDGVLYGMTSEGGKDGDGTLYQVNLAGTGFGVLKHFKSSDGTDPHGFVIEIGHHLYGMTREGGQFGGGVIFDFDLKTTNYTVLHPFNPAPQKNPANDDGFGPDHGGLIQVGNFLYGLATGGGQYGDGTLFEVSTNGEYHTLHPFSGTSGIPGVMDGSGPHGSLVLGPDNVTLFGMTSDGGSANDGAVFAFDTATTKLLVIRSFLGSPNDGKDGLDNVVVFQGSLFGLTKYGGDVKSTFKPNPPNGVNLSAGSPSHANGVIFTMPLVNPTSVALAISGNTSVIGQRITVTASVQGMRLGSSTPPGTVTFFNGANVLTVVPLMGGRASFNTITTSSGSATITARYSGFAFGAYSFGPSSKSTSFTVKYSNSHFDHLFGLGALLLGFVG